MAVTSVQFADQHRFLGQIDKIVQSHSLRKAESLCKLLRYLADHAVRQPGVALKEYQIAVEVFGRPKTFDPQADSAIRVQAGRLRLKLLDYYSHEGVADPIVVEMPYGVYALEFHEKETRNPAPVPISTAGENARPFEVPSPRQNNRGSLVAVATLSSALALALVTVAVLSITLRSARLAKPGDSAVPVALHDFWNPFVSGPDAPWVIFSNASFVGRPETGMRYLDPERDSRAPILDHYTGVGEVLAVHELDKTFRILNHRVEVKRGSLFTLDDAKKTDLIFVGSPAENLTLLDFPGSQEFVFKRLESTSHKGNLGIVNVHPEPGQPAIFYPSDPSQTLIEDYAIIAFLQGLNPARHVLILAGTTTIGTQAAAEYVCGKDSVEELLHRLTLPAGAELKPFEALLRVKVTHGVPVGVQLIAVRNRK
jgi:hypothetical protein